MKSIKNWRSFGFLSLCFLALALLVPDIVCAASYISISKAIRSDFDNSIDLTTSNPNDGSRDVVFRITITNTGTSGVYVHSTDDLGNGQFYSADPSAPYDRDNIWVPAHSNYVYDFRARYQGSNTTHGAAITSTARIIWIDGCYNYLTGDDCGVHGNLTSSKTAYIHNPPNQSPTAGITMTSGGQTAYENQTLSLTVSSGGTAQVSFSASRSSDSDGSISSYVWKISGTQVSTSRDFAFSLGKGTHQVYLTVTDNQGAQGSVGASIIVTEQTSNQPPVAKLSITSGGQTAYENETLNLSVSAGGTAQVDFSASRSSDPDGSISSYLWKISGNQKSTSKDFNFSLGKGTHQVYLTVTDNQGAQGSVGASIIVTEQTSNQPPVAKLSITSGGQTAYENQILNLIVSSGGTVQVAFSASRSSDPDGSISSYIWKISGTQASTSRDFSFSLAKGTHQIYLTVTDNQGAQGSVGASIIVTEQTSNQPPVAKLSITSGGQTAYENETLNLSVSAGGTAQVAFSASRSSDPDGSISSYLWKISGNQKSTSKDFNFSLGKGTHQIYLAVTDNQGAQGSVGASIVIEETSTSTTSTSTTTSTTSTTSISTSTTSTTSTPTSTTSTTTTTLPGSSKITTISVPCVIKDRVLSTGSSLGHYKFTLSSQSDVTVSLISTDFDTHLRLKNAAETINEENDNSQAFDMEIAGYSTNSQISLGGLSADTYFIQVSSSDFRSGQYTLVIRDIGTAKIETICHKMGELFPAVFPGENWPDDPNHWIAKMEKITDTAPENGPRCVGRCGKGCPGDGFPSCDNVYRYTQDCFNHDVCAGHHIKGIWSRQCTEIFVECTTDCNKSISCAGPQYVNSSGICAGKTPCTLKVQSAIDAGGDGSTIRLSTGIYSEHLTTTPKTMILWGGWDESFSTNSSTSTVNSLTITDGKIIVDNLVIQ